MSGNIVDANIVRKLDAQVCSGHQVEQYICMLAAEGPSMCDAAVPVPDKEYTVVTIM